MFFARFATTAAAVAAVAAATNIYQGALVVSIAVPSCVCIDDCINLIKTILSTRYTYKFSNSISPNIISLFYVKTINIFYHTVF